MGDSEKKMKSKRKPRSRKPNNNPPRTMESNLELVPSKSDKNSVLGQALYHPSPRQCDPNPELDQASCGHSGKNNAICNLNLNQHVCSGFSVKNVKHYTDEQLEELLLKKLEAIYHEAYTRLISHGYQPDVVMKAILTNGHGFGNMDILTNIVQNSLGFLKTGFVIDKGNYKEGQQVFGDMKMLVKYSLPVMICLLQQVRPNLTKADALWCLLISNFHLGVASTVKVPGVTHEDESQVADNKDSVHDSSGVCKVEGNQLSGDGRTHDFSKNDLSGKLDVLLDRNCSIVKNFKLKPSLKAKLKMNIGNFAAAYHAGFEMSPKQLQASKSSLPSKNITDSFEWENSYMVNLVMGNLGNLSLHKKTESEPLNPKNEIVTSLVNNIKEMKKQVKEREEWAQEKVVQAAKKLSDDLSELGRLRLEREPEKKLVKGQADLEEETMTRLMELEDALRKAGCQADLAKAAIKKLEVENAVIRAEVEAFKLRASESNKMCLEVVRREKKYLKKILALEKQNKKYLEEIEEEKSQSLHLQQKLVDLKNAQEEIEVMWRQEVKAKELAIAQVQEELRLKKEVTVNINRKRDALHQKMEINCQRSKDDIQRLEQEISRLQLSLDSSNLHQLQDAFFTVGLEHTRPERSTFQIMLPALNEALEYSEEEIICDRVCWSCRENEASIVFLPCAHQVLCATCSEYLCRDVGGECPCCRDPIAQLIRVYGTGS